MATPKSPIQVNATVPLRPLGKTPISDALLIASDAVNWQEKPSTVVLISDGLETCDQDPCLVASALERTGVDFVIHVVGPGLSQEENAALSCIAQNTGGLSLAADNAGELAEALVRTVVAPPSVVTEAPQPFTTRLQGTYGAGGPNLVGNATWWILGPNGRVIAGPVVGTRPEFELDPGRYTVEVSQGRVSGAAPIVVPQPDMQNLKVERTIALDAGVIAPFALRSENGPRIESIVEWRLSSVESDPAFGDPIAISEFEPHFAVPPGTYSLSASFGGITVSRTLPVDLGAILETGFVLAPGRITARALLPGQSEPLRSGVRWRLFARGEDGSLTEMENTLSPISRFDVPAGEYVLRFSRGGYTADTEPFELISTLYIFRRYAAKQNAWAIRTIRSGGILSSSRSGREC